MYLVAVLIHLSLLAKHAITLYNLKQVHVVTAKQEKLCEPVGVVLLVTYMYKHNGF